MKAVPVRLEVESALSGYLDTQQYELLLTDVQQLSGSGLFEIIF